MHSRLLIVSLVALCSWSMIALAQGGSNYSALGIGDLCPWVGAQYDAMSGTQIGMPTPYGINLVNPSLMGISPTTRIQAGYRFSQHLITDNGTSVLQNNGNLDGIAAMFSVDTARGFAFTLAITPFSKVAYLVQRTLHTEFEGGQIDGTSLQQGEGGVSQIQLSASVRLLPTLRVGLGFGGLFGLQTYSDKLTLYGSYSQVYSSQSYDVRGLLYRGGVYWEPSAKFGIGAFVSGGGDGSDYITRRASGIALGSMYFDTVAIQSATAPMPIQYGVGGSIELGSGRLGADVHIMDYTRLTVNVRDDAGYTTGVRTSLGYADFGSQNPGAPFGARVGWYAGASFQKLYVTYIGSSIHEYSGSTGLSFPLGGNAMVDAGVSAGWRGPVDVSALTEYFGRLTITVSIGETWFKPFARD